MAIFLLDYCKDVEGTWYAPEKHLQQQRDVVRVELWNTTSSAGDWSGYFVQKFKRRFYLITFCQENLIDTPYFRLKTCDAPVISFNHKPAKEECDRAISELVYNL